jgi:hypothetical protein
MDPRIVLGRASNLTTVVVELPRAQLFRVRQELSPAFGEEDREGRTLIYA